MHRLSAVVASGVLLLATACGGGGDRPSVDEISKALREAGDDSLLGPAAERLDKKSADCVSELLVESKISDKSLKALADGDLDYEGSTADRAVVAKLAPKLVKCIPTQ